VTSLFLLKVSLKPKHSISTWLYPRFSSAANVRRLAKIYWTSQPKTSVLTTEPRCQPKAWHSRGRGIWGTDWQLIITYVCVGVFVCCLDAAAGKVERIWRQRLLATGPCIALSSGEHFQNSDETSCQCQHGWPNRMQSAAYGNQKRSVRSLDDLWTNLCRRSTYIFSVLLLVINQRCP